MQLIWDYLRENCREIDLMLRNYDVLANFAAVLAPIAGEEDDVGDATLLWPWAIYLSMSPDDVIGVPPGVGVVSGVLGVGVGGVGGVGRGGGVWVWNLGMVAKSLKGGNFVGGSYKW